MSTSSSGGQRDWPLIPASFFAMTLGLAETGSAWRMGASLWHLPTAPGEVLQALGAASFVFWLTLFVYKWGAHREAAVTELHDPVQSSFIALIPESVILMALAALPYQRELAELLFWIGSITNLLFGAYRMARSWSEERAPAQTVPPLFLTYTASVLVNALAAGLFGYTSYGWAVFGVGIVSWVIMDSVISQQLISGMLASKTRNFMGIYMAPAVVAFAAYQVLSGDAASMPLTSMLAGYGVFLAVGLLLAWRWLREQAFAPGYWAYTFGVATLAQGLILMAGRADQAGVHVLAAISFIGSLALTLAVAIGTVRLFLQGRYFPAPAAAVAAAPVAPVANASVRTA